MLELRKTMTETEKTTVRKNRKISSKNRKYMQQDMDLECRRRGSGVQ
jgi:hypothetical protein